MEVEVWEGGRRIGGVIEVWEGERRGEVWEGGGMEGWYGREGGGVEGRGVGGRREGEWSGIQLQTTHCFWDCNYSTPFRVLLRKKSTRSGEVWEGGRRGRGGGLGGRNEDWRGD